MQCRLQESLSCKSASPSGGARCLRPGAAVAPILYAHPALTLGNFSPPVSRDRQGESQAMASSKGRVGKRKARDPELAELLKLSLAKLGDDSEERCGGESDKDEAAEERPRCSHVPPALRFPQ
ncbi:hypothetical protein NDU88_003903 [Pleurodeles waltl]|uniref:Uncharacterized protein n=1 Tax=Pleurodeles waltl TaxID=8319 RepID=A0AAV7LID6_PLEWA|nr:hypothetical protein NDU88_003903 [Pleurodeles waltl]